MGALETFAVLGRHEYWRLVTSLFLHYNLTHLCMNVFALYVLGPPLEQTIGSTRFAFTYLIAGIGSTIGVIGLTLLRVLPPAQLVGASGCVMGIVGAWAGYLLRHRHIPQARRRLMNILMIVGVQTIFDFVTPQSSMSAHLCGLVTGFLAGLAISARDARAL
jgi:rhomboid protease GluP